MIIHFDLQYQPAGSRAGLADVSGIEGGILSILLIVIVLSLHQGLPVWFEWHATPSADHRIGRLIRCLCCIEGPNRTGAKHKQQENRVTAAGLNRVW